MSLGTTLAAVTLPTTLDELRRIARAQPAEATVLCCLGASGGVGTSVVALALADALATLTGPDPTMLVDLADATTSGLLAVAERELPAGLGERRGIRGALTVLRDPQGALLAGHGTSYRVVDAGSLAGSTRRGGVPAVLSTGQVVLVGRATVPGVRRVETALDELAIGGREPAVVVLVGRGRRPRVVQASMGPRLRHLTSQRRCHDFPWHRRLEVDGLDSRPLPRQLQHAAHHLVGALHLDDELATGRTIR